MVHNPPQRKTDMSRPEAQSTLKGLDSLASLGQEANGAVQAGRAGEAFGGSAISPAARRLGDFWSQATEYQTLFSVQVLLWASPVKLLV